MIDASEKDGKFAISRRKSLMQACAASTVTELKDFIAAYGANETFASVRGPETGLVLVRGRIGGGGSPFNLGDVTASRASVRLMTGEIGHGQLLGTNREHARLAAIVDALAQKPELTDAVDTLVESIIARVVKADEKRAAQVAATRVDFFTLVRGDD